jgi:hypothetical protein
LQVIEVPIFSRQSALTDGGEVVSLTHQQPFTPRKIPGTHLCLRLSRPQGHSQAGRIRSTEKSNDLIGNQTHSLPACSRVPQQTTLPRAPPLRSAKIKNAWIITSTPQTSLLKHRDNFIFTLTYTTSTSFIQSMELFTFTILFFFLNIMLLLCF